MENYKKLSLISFVIILTGCSSGKDLREAHYGFGYKNSTELKQMKFLPGTQQFVDNTFDVPNSKYQGQIGNNVDLRAPTSIIFDPTKMNVSKEGNLVNIQFESIKQAEYFMQRSRIYFKSKDIQLIQNNKLFIQTNKFPINSSDVDDLNIITAYSLTSEGNRVKIKNTFYNQRTNQNISYKLEKDRVFNNLINELLYYYQSNQNQTKDIKMQSQKSSVNLKLVDANTDQLQEVIIANMSYDDFISSLPYALNQLGFQVNVINQSEGKISTQYEKDENKPLSKIDLDEGNYIIQLGQSGNQTSLYLTNEKNRPVNAREFKSFYDALKKAYF
ncbi:hypothetical protein CF386_01200 [Paraphotobacterium marinum]|uniref:Outer membrane protein assembly factor BamC n=1 Tax=Paraphotobacterium marinum TaxID=1755811 RepID=A0A220VBS6_9GAMM|nr:outer membrane protein assembly factor BamC [Paraphotobacterium marinum]ASK77789.1 hypothetical protein CF386_01200 [Paraphotobacterium marinum]